MSEAKVYANVDRDNVEFLVDLGHPLLNRVVDGFVKVGGVGVLHAATQDAAGMIFKEEADKQSLENMVHRAGKEAVQWGLVAGMYSGVSYAMQEVRGRHDWKNAMLSGALTGAAVSLTESNASQDRVLKGAISGAAIATAAEFLRNLS